MSTRSIHRATSKLPWCSRCGTRRAQKEWHLPPEEKRGWCWECKRNVAGSRVRHHMQVYQTFKDVDRTLPNGTYIRIEGEGYYNGVYKVQNGGNYSQGYVWGKYVFPGPAYVKGFDDTRQCQLRRWPGDVPPDYVSACDDADDEV